MNKLIQAPRRLARRLVSPLRRPQAEVWLESQPGFAVPADAIEALHGAPAFRQALLDGIAQATRRIVIVALYLQDDEAGRAVMDALYAAQAQRPQLEIDVYVDWHRAQRGLIGKHKSPGNAAMYREYAERFGDGVRVWGVPVQNRELFGVLHLKGFVFDDTVLYSGASLNEVYLGTGGRYRLDRYHLVRDRALADSMAGFVQQYFQGSDAVQRLDAAEVPSTRSLLPAIRGFRQQLQQARYAVPAMTLAEGQVAITPLLGFGRTDNQLNEAVLTLLCGAKRKVVLLTPYFNLPRPVRVVLGQLLRRGCTIEIMVGDKTANDFYIPPSQPFRTIGLLPYLYENNLRRYARAHRRQLASGQLTLRLWRDDGNSYHLKGLFVDDEVTLLTGHNLNPRAWALDLENGLLLRDPDRKLLAQRHAEWAELCRHAQKVDDFHALESPRSYPPEVRKLLRRLSRVRLDRLVNRLL